jgi:hypothetical protein
MQMKKEGRLSLWHRTVQLPGVHHRGAHANFQLPSRLLSAGVSDATLDLKPPQHRVPAAGRVSNPSTGVRTPPRDKQRLKP